MHEFLGVAKAARAQLFIDGAGLGTVKRQVCSKKPAESQQALNFLNKLSFFHPTAIALTNFINIINFSGSTLV